MSIPVRTFGAFQSFRGFSGRMGMKLWIMPRICSTPTIFLYFLMFLFAFFLPLPRGGRFYSILER